MGTPDNPPVEAKAESKIQELWLKWRMFVAGFLGWLLFSGLVWYLLLKFSMADPYETIAINCIWLFFTLGVMLFFALKKGTRMFSLGILTAIALNAVISIIRGAITNAICFMPFFVPGY